MQKVSLQHAVYEGFEITNWDLSSSPLKNKKTPTFIITLVYNKILNKNNKSCFNNSSLLINNTKSTHQLEISIQIFLNISKIDKKH